VDSQTLKRSDLSVSAKRNQKYDCTVSPYRVNEQQYQQAEHQAGEHRQFRGRGGEQIETNRRYAKGRYCGKYDIAFGLPHCGCGCSLSGFHAMLRLKKY
jgi:hypothetical protein